MGERLEKEDDFEGLDITDPRKIEKKEDFEGLDLKLDNPKRTKKEKEYWNLLGKENRSKKE